MISEKIVDSDVNCGVQFCWVHWPFMLFFHRPSWEFVYQCFLSQLYIRSHLDFKMTGAQQTSSIFCTEVIYVWLNFNLIHSFDSNCRQRWRKRITIFPVGRSFSVLGSKVYVLIFFCIASLFCSSLRLFLYLLLVDALVILIIIWSYLIRFGSLPIYNWLTCIRHKSLSIFSSVYNLFTKKGSMSS